MSVSRIIYTAEILWKTNKGTGLREMNDSEKTIETAAESLMQDLGIWDTSIGYEYLKRAIVLTAQQPELLNSMKSIYNKIAEIYNVRSNCIERGIRYVIDITYERNPDALVNYFNYPMSKPGSSELISLAADDIRLLFL